MIFAITTLISALSISLIAAYFSIIGLATIFPGSMYAVIAMGSVLEVGKIIASIWLHKNWKSAPVMIKVYLFSAILVLMGITSMGIFGFLSKSHIEHEQNSEKARALVTQVETKIARESEYIQRQKDLILKNEQKNENLSDKSSENIELEQNKISQLTTQLEKDIEIDNKMLAPIELRLNKLNEELNIIKNKSGGLFSSKKKDIEEKIIEQAKEREELNLKKKEIEKRISKYRGETSQLISDIRKRIQEYQVIGFEKPEDAELKIEKLNQNISEALNKIDELERQKFDMDDGSRQLEAEVGPLKYVAEFISDLTGSSFDIGKAVRIVIIILIFVFDPLAILLVLAAHISLSKTFSSFSIDEDDIFKKTSELELKKKLLDDQEQDLEERQKDLNQEDKILKLKEGQVEKYKAEISKNKEKIRQLKIESEKQMLKKEDTSQIMLEIESLEKLKQSAKNEIEEIKIEKNKILNKADEAIQSAKEIKVVLGEHKKQKDRIDELKSEVCMNIEKFSEFKNHINLLESENMKLKNRKLPDPNQDLIKKIESLTDQKNTLLEENLKAKNQKLFKVKIKSLNDRNFELAIPSDLSGTHCYYKEADFTDKQLEEYLNISKYLDAECPERDAVALDKLYHYKINLIVDPKISNREYKKLRANYKFNS
jgi:chromosome segregation ATPase